MKSVAAGIPKKRIVGRSPPGVAGPKARHLRFLALMEDEVSQGDWKTIIRKAVTQAKKGDRYARRFLADNLIGLPIPRPSDTGDSYANNPYRSLTDKELRELASHVYKAKDAPKGKAKSKTKAKPKAKTTPKRRTRVSPKKR